MIFSTRFAACVVVALMLDLLSVLYFLMATRDDAVLLQQLLSCAAIGALLLVGCLLRALATQDAANSQIGQA
ncbi:hypothetical protein RA280_15980 [Cupriavidus sp. CV2]|uniref:hypothetical protein n=1 Tax=Cupriavidus ulmosensis TaxID=3065913 RepID=UPI00296ACE54|nr:hypothetical protein [Cupriavidus sp. CV2]MDW3683223.1 hypothetical protein [Cupriavidus sp. CV2]